MTSVQAMRAQLSDDAMTMLVLWATRQDYDAVRVCLSSSFFCCFTAALCSALF